MANVHRPRLACLLDGHLRGIDRDPALLHRRLRAWHGRPHPPPADLLGNRADAWILIGCQRQLATERGFDSLRQR